MARLLLAAAVCVLLTCTLGKTVTPSASKTASISVTASKAVSPSISVSSSKTPSVSVTPSISKSVSVTSSKSISASKSPAASASSPASASPSKAASVSAAASTSPPASSSPASSPVSASPTGTASASPASASLSPTVSPTISYTAAASMSAGMSSTATVSVSPSFNYTASVSPTISVTPSPNAAGNGLLAASSSGLSSNDKVGLGVGLGVGLAAVASVLIFFAIKRHGSSKGSGTKAAPTRRASPSNKATTRPSDYIDGPDLDSAGGGTEPKPDGDADGDHGVDALSGRTSPVLSAEASDRQVVKQWDQEAGRSDPNKPLINSDVAVMVSGDAGAHSVVGAPSRPSPSHMRATPTAHAMEEGVVRVRSPDPNVTVFATIDSPTHDYESARHTVPKPMTPAGTPAMFSQRRSQPTRASGNGMPQSRAVPPRNVSPSGKTMLSVGSGTQREAEAEVEKAMHEIRKQKAVQALLAERLAEEDPTGEYRAMAAQRARSQSPRRGPVQHQSSSGGGSLPLPPPLSQARPTFLPPFPRARVGRSPSPRLYSSRSRSPVLPRVSPRRSPRAASPRDPWDDVMLDQGMPMPVMPVAGGMPMPMYHPWAMPAPMMPPPRAGSPRAGSPRATSPRGRPMGMTAPPAMYMFPPPASSDRNSTWFF